MGDFRVRKINDAHDRRKMYQHALNDIEAFEIMLKEKMFEAGPPKIGAEQELCIVNKNATPEFLSKKSMKIFKTSFLLFLFFFALTCANVNQEPEDGNVVISPINPNGDSELALLMRAMFDDVQRMKTQIEKGETPTPTVDFEKMFTAQATEPDKQASQKFKAFGDHHLNMLKDLQKASPEQRLELYQDLVESCMTCHRALCPGPTVKIKKLYSKKN